jgi:hypothetical protein
MAFGGVRGTLFFNAASITNPTTAVGSVGVSQGDLIVAFLAEQTTLTVSAVTDNLGNTYTAVNAGTDAGVVTGRAFYAWVSNGGTLTAVNFAATASSNNVVVQAVAFEGYFDPSPLDAAPANTSADLTTPYPTPATGTLAQADEIVLSWICQNGNVTLTPTAPHTLAIQTVTATIHTSAIGYELVAATTSVQPSWTSSATPVMNVMGTASFKKGTAAAGIARISGSNTTYAARVNTTVTAPPGIANGDVMIAEIQFGRSGGTYPTDLTAPGGWSQIGSPGSLTDTFFSSRLHTFIKVASGESGSYTWTHASATSQGQIQVYRGVDTTTPQDATSTINGGGEGPTRTWTGLTTLTNNAWIVAHGVDWGDTSNNLTPPSGMTERLDTVVAYAADEALPTAGATGNRSHTCNAASSAAGEHPWSARLVALRPLSTSVAGNASGATITAAGNLIAGAASASGAGTATGATLTRAATLIAGVAVAGGTTYVRKTGNNTTGTGTSANPYLTMEKGIDESTMPCTVIVGNGTYNESLYLPSGLTLRAENPGMVLLRASSGNAITGDGINNVEIDGLDINTSAANCHGVEIKSSHHITVRRCISHNNANSGISLPWGEFLTVEDCTCYGNGRGGWYSGITFYQSRNITGDTTTAGPRNVIRNCLVYDNWTTGGSTDGNGILIDDWQHTQPYGPDPEDWLGVIYPYGGLVENCIAYGNGNKGIGIAWCNGVTIRNNVCYKNGIDGSQGTWRGDLSNQAGENNTFANNIAVADSSGAGSRSANTAIGNYAVGANGEACTGTVWFNNLTYHTNNTSSTSLNINGPGCATPTVGNGNKLATNPLFVNAAAFDFHLQSGSPCLNAGTATYGLPANDNEGNPRVSGAAVDIGAYEYDTGTATAAGATLTAPASLIAGAASAVRNPTAAGATLTTASSLTAGTASGVRSPTVSGQALTTAASFIAGAATAAGNATATGATLTTAGSLLSGAASASRTISGATLTAAGSLTAGAATGAAIAAGQTLARAATLQGGTAAGGGSASVPGATFTTATSIIAGTASAVRNPTVTGATLTMAGSLIPGTAAAGAGATAFGGTLSASGTLTGGTARGDAATVARTITAPGGILAGAASGTATVSGQVFTRAASMLPGSANGAGGATVPGIIQTAGLSLIAGTASATSSATAAGVTLSARITLYAGTPAAPRITQVRAPLGYYRPVVEQTAERPEATSPSRSVATQTARRT